MELVEYEDCLSLRFSAMSGEEIEEHGECLTVDLDLVNGARTEVDLVVGRGPEGNYEILEILLDKSLAEEFVEDVADLEWYVFPPGSRVEVPPVIASWEDRGVTVAACQAAKYGGAPEDFQRQMARLQDAERDPDPDRALCWWPEGGTWSMMENVPSESGPKLTYCHAFYTFREWFARRDLAHTPYGERAAEFARHLRQIRTILLRHQRQGQAVRLTAGDVRRAERFFRDKGLDPYDRGSWSTVAMEFAPMTDVLLETARPCGTSGILGVANLTAVVSLLSHLPGSASYPDCIGAALYTGQTHVANLFAWCNPLDGPTGVAKASERLVAQIDRYRVRETAMLEGMLPFEACPACGDLTLRGPDEFESGTPVRVDPRPGRNDPCPCGSGRKYKKCCGRP